MSESFEPRAATMAALLQPLHVTPCEDRRSGRAQRHRAPDVRRERVSAHPRIVAIKDASTNTGRLLSILNRCGDRIAVFSASAHIPAAVMLIGGVGWMAGPACLVPRQSVALYGLPRRRV